MSDVTNDPWAKWLLDRRYGGSLEELRHQLDFLYPVRDRVLDNARLAPGETLLDVGCGDGLIAFGALARVGDAGRVIFSDVSNPLLDHCRELAGDLRLDDRCTFIRASADDLAEIGDRSVDVVTTRSVLIYLPFEAKRRALREFFRVLRPGGRISLFEPINRFRYPEPPYLLLGYQVTAVRAAADKVREVYLSRQPPGSDSMTDFDERDLVDFCDEAGFDDWHLTLEIGLERLPPRAWDTFVRMSFNPRMPTLEEAMAEALTPREIDLITAHLRPLVERGEGRFPLALAYLWATKRD